MIKLEFMVISLVFLLCIRGNNQYVWGYLGPRGVKFTYKPSTEFYEGQPFEFSCDAGINGTSYEDTESANRPESIYVSFFSKELRYDQMRGCEYNGNARADNRPYIPQWNNLTSDDCGNRDRKLEQITITGNITRAMQREYSRFTCNADYRTDRLTAIGYSDHNNILSAIPDFKVEPQNLTLSLSGVVEEGKRFNFSCKSVKAKPSSRYTYQLQRVSDKLFLDLEDTFYEPSRQDREGINITCTDESHINFPGSESNIIKWIQVMPKYVEFKDRIGKETVKTIFLENETPSSFHLYCDVFRSSVGLGYVWFLNGLELAEIKDNLQITTSDLRNGNKVDCKVGFAGGQTSKQYSWIFRREESKQQTRHPIILGSVAIVVLIVAISLALYCKRKPQAHSVPSNTVAPRGNPLAADEKLRGRGKNRSNPLATN